MVHFSQDVHTDYIASYVMHVDIPSASNSSQVYLVVELLFLKDLLTVCRKRFVSVGVCMQISGPAVGLVAAVLLYQLLYSLRSVA